MKKSWFIASILILLAACSSDHKINEKEVEKTVNELYADQPICLRVHIALDDDEMIPNYQFGDTEIKIKSQDITGKKVNQYAIDQMNILKKQGFYKETKTEKIRLQDNITVRYRVWTITDKGMTYFGGGDAVCVGHFEFAKMQYYSIPASSFGRQISHVTYTVQPKIDRWARSFLAITDKNYEKYLGKEQSRSSTFYLTNKGWKILRGNI